MFFFPNIKIVSQHYPLVSPLCPLPLIKNVPGHAIHLFLPCRTSLRTGALRHQRRLCQGQHLRPWLRRRTLNYEKTGGPSQYTLVRYVLVLGFFKLSDSAKIVQRTVTILNVPIVSLFFVSELCYYRSISVVPIEMGFQGPDFSGVYWFLLFIRWFWGK